MTKNIENTKNIQLKSQKALKAENEILREENKTLSETIRGLKERCSEYSQHIMELEAEIKDMKFAKECLGVPMTPADIAEREFISQGEQHYEDTWNINCGDDF